MLREQNVKSVKQSEKYYSVMVIFMMAKLEHWSVLKCEESIIEYFLFFLMHCFMFA